MVRNFVKEVAVEMKKFMETGIATSGKISSGDESAEFFRDGYELRVEYLNDDMYGGVTITVKGDEILISKSKFEKSRKFTKELLGEIL
jgi:hypothetical protein